MSKKQTGFWNTPLTDSLVKSPDVKLPEMLIGYFIGPFGALLSSGIFTSFLNKYFTDVLKLDTGFLSVLQLVSTLLIVAANLIVGQLIERTRVLAGKARPWVLLSALTLSVSSVLMFIVPFEGTAKMVWIAIAYNLYYAVAYPIYNTANSTLIPVSTRNSQQRGALASFTNVAGLGVMGVGSMIFPVLVSNVMKEDQHRWFLVMLGVAIFSALTIYLQFKFTRERVTEELLGEGSGAARVKTASMGEQLKAVTSEKWWWLILLFYLAFQCSGAMKNGSMSYFCQWVIGAAGTIDWGMAQTILAVLGAIPMAVAAAVVVPLANKLSKRVVVMTGMLVGVAGGIIAGLGGGQIVPVAIGVALKCLGSAPAAYLILAMLADVIDHIEFKSGIRTDGLTMSIYSSVMVAATPICNAVFMAMLGGSGYVAPPKDAAAAAAMTQSAAVQSTIGISYIWIETVAYAICAALMLLWTVERDLPAEQETIAQRKRQCR
ncbi:MAG: MFS transporter [Oscillospiraceae bacterium]|nr:MFS transporter [Oscillospiraceae bacterium]